MLVELFDLHPKDKGFQWREAARWLKYEEDVEGVDSHRGRPHVSFLSFKSLDHLRRLIANGVVLLDPQVYNVQEIINLIISHVSVEKCINSATAVKVGNLLSESRIRCHEKAFGLMRLMSIQSNMPSRASSIKRGSTSNGAITTPRRHKKSNASTASNSTVDPEIDYASRVTKQRNAEGYALEDQMDAAQIYSGHVADLEEPLFVMIRLPYGMFLPEIMDHIVQLRFIFFIIGPYQLDFSYHQVGRALSTLMASKNFQEMTLDAQNRDMLIRGIDDFLNTSYIIPPTEIDSKDLFNVESIQKVFGRETLAYHKEDHRRESLSKVTVHPSKTKEVDMATEGKLMQAEHVQVDPFVRTKKPFGGAILDLKNRLPYYWDDIKTALHYQCFTSILFIFFANFASAVALGEVLSVKTEGWMGVTEILIAHGVCGVLWGLFSGQPLCIMAAVGPFLVFEESLYLFCLNADVDFLATRVWTAFWTFLLLIVCAMVEAPAMMKYLNRFTEDIFTGLIAFIFVWEAAKFMWKEFNAHPLQKIEQYCSVLSAKNARNNLNTSSEFILNTTDVSFINGSFDDDDDDDDKKDFFKHQLEDFSNQPDTALLEFILVIVTFLVAYTLKKLRMSIYCGRPLRKAIGDFGVPVAVLVGTLVDQVIFSDVYTKHVNMTGEFNLTRPDLRGWFVHPMGSGDEWLPSWVIPATIIPAFLVTILLYAEVEIIEKLIMKPELGCKKPGGFHWDLILCGALAFLCSLFGLQWMCPAAVQSLSHASSLTVMKRAAPGEAPQIDYVLEQRITAIIIGLLHAAAAFCGFALKYIPVSVLFGLFLYLGVMGLLGIQFYHRIILFFVPQKYFPNEPHCQQVSMRRLHMYTAIQLACFVGLWCVNMFPKSALTFPFILCLIAVFRKVAIPKIFTEKELTAIEGKPVTLAKGDQKKVENVDEDFYDRVSIAK